MKHSILQPGPRIADECFQMKLSPETFRELTSALGVRKEGAPDERRRSIRVDVRTRIPLSLVDKGQHQPAVPIMVRDVSPRGINIVFPQRLDAGQQFTVMLGGQKGFLMLCTVMHSQSLSNGMHSIGAEFTCVLPRNGARSATDAKTMQRIRDSVME